MTTTLTPTITPSIPATPRPGAAGARRPALARRFASRAARAVGHGIAVLLPVVFITTFITFVLGSLTGQDPAASVLGDNARPEDVARMHAVFGLDRTFFVRYFDWLWHALHGNLGSSWFSHIPVVDSVVQR